jgi:hypothetical protein
MSFSQPWSAATQDAIDTVGRLASAMEAWVAVKGTRVL